MAEEGAWTWKKHGGVWHVSRRTGTTLCSLGDMKFDGHRPFGDVAPFPRCRGCLDVAKRELGLV